MSRAMSPQSTEPLQLQDADGFYEALLNTHQGLDAEQSALLNARLILVLANRIGDTETLNACLRIARDTPDLPAPQAPADAG
ncbi:MAG: DUF2783 domain-containing protein [Burkholderiaceae bacterium]